MNSTNIMCNSIYGNHTHILNNRSVLIRIPVKVTDQITRFHNVYRCICRTETHNAQPKSLTRIYNIT